MSPGSAHVRRVISALVLLLHLALLAWWVQGDQRTLRSAAEVPRVTVRLVAARPPAAPPVAPSAGPSAPPPRHAGPAPRATRPARPQAALAARPEPAVVDPQALTMPAPAPAASRPPGETPPSLMDGEATRRAIRAAAREPGIATVAGRQGPALQTPDERLGSEVQRSARGDCLKGEYLGGGMGLLSLPFLAAAALRDQCRR